MNVQTARRLFMGLLLIGVGALFLAAQLGYIDIDISEIVPTYWPVILIVIGISGLITDRKGSGTGSWMWSLFMMALGGFFLMRNLGYTNMSAGDIVKLLIPVFIIFFGLRMILSPSREKKPKEKPDTSYQYDYKYEYKYDSNLDNPPPADPLQEPEPKTSHTSHTHGPEKVHQQESWSWQSGENRSGFIGDLYLGNDYWELKPMNVSHFIGDTTIDLTKAQIPLGVTKLNISAFIGDVKIFVLNDVDVEFDVNSSSFLGDITVFGRKEGGLMRSMREVTPGYKHADKKIKLNCNLFIGDIQVQRVG